MYTNPYMHKTASKYDYGEGTYRTDKPLFSFRPSEANISYTTKDGKTYKYDANNVASWRNIKAAKEEFNKLLKAGELTSDEIARIITGDNAYAKMYRQHLASIKDSDWNKVMFPLSRQERLALKAAKPSYTDWGGAAYVPTNNRIRTSIFGLGASNPLSTTVTNTTRLTNNAAHLFKAMDEDTLRAEVLSHELNHAATIADLTSRRNARKGRKTGKAIMRNSMRGQEMFLNNVINPLNTQEGRKGVAIAVKDIASTQAGDDMKSHTPVADDLVSVSKALDPYSFIGAERIQAVAKNMQALYAAQKLMREQPELFNQFDMNARKKFLSLKAPATSKKQFIDRMEFFLQYPEFGLLLGEGSRLIPVYNELKNLRTVIPIRNKNKGKGFLLELLTPD